MELRGAEGGEGGIVMESGSEDGVAGEPGSWGRLGRRCYALIKFKYLFSDLCVGYVKRQAARQFI